MILNYQYRAYPDNSQKLELNYWRRVAQYWYNWQLGDRFHWWSQRGKNDLKSLTKRNKIKQDEDGKYLPNGQSAKSGLNKSWLDAAKID